MITIYIDKLSKYLRSLILLTVIFATSCNGSLPASKYTAVQRHKWIEKWLTEPACLPPCWENVEPGITSATRAQELIKQVPEVTDFKVSIENPLARDQLEMIWSFEHSKDSGAAYTNEEGIISRISLSPSKEQNLRVGEIIESFGEPSRVHVFDCRENKCAVRVIFLEKGLFLDSLLSVKGDHVLLSENNLVYFVWFFPAGEEGFLEVVGEKNLKYVEQHIWKGYNSYSVP